MGHYNFMNPPDNVRVTIGDQTKELKTWISTGVLTNAEGAVIRSRMNQTSSDVFSFGRGNHVAHSNENYQSCVQCKAFTVIY